MFFRNFTTSEEPYTKEEPVDDLPVEKKCKTSSNEQQTVSSNEQQTISSNEQQTIFTPFPDQNVNDLMAGLEKMSHPSPSSTIFGGDARNSNESTPFSQEQSPASSYMMSPHTDHENAYSITSPQSSIDESQVLSPEQEASIPLTVLDKMGVNGNPGYNPAVNGSHSYSPTVNGSHSYSPAVNGNLGYNQSEQVYNRSYSLPEQHPTLTTLLTGNNSKDGLRTKILSKNIPSNGQEPTLDFSNQGLGTTIMQQLPNFHQQQNNIQLVDLNTLQNYTNGITELQQTNIDMTSSNHLENIVIESDAIELEEEIVEMNEMNERFNEITPSNEFTENQLQLLASLEEYQQQNQQANTINNSDTNPLLTPVTLAQVFTLFSDLPNSQINMQLQ